MTPKDKALQLIDAFDEYAESRISDDGRGFDKKYCSKQCALIAANEIIQTLNWDIRDLDVRGSVLLDLITYWRNVETEIERL
jgi:hypothetical protein